MEPLTHPPRYPEGGEGEEEEEEDEMMEDTLADDGAEVNRINKEKSVSLEYLLGHRSTHDQLLQQNIMHGKVGVAPAIQQTQRTLRFQQTVDTLDHKLVNRPNKEQLLNTNIIRSKSADNIQAREVALKFQRTVEKIDQKLDIRPSYNELQAQNIIKVGIAPSLYATQTKLKFIVTAESLDHKLVNRPPRSVLVASNIVKGSDGIAPSISAAQQELKFHTVANTLDQKIIHRPTPDSLMDHNIIKERGVHASIQSRQQALKFNKTKSQVGHKMHSRPSKGSLVEQNILFDESPFLRETKKKLIRRRVSSSLASHLEHRPTREEFDLRFRYYFTDSESGSSIDNSSFVDTASYVDTASCAGDAGDADDAHATTGMVRAKSLPNCAFEPPPTIREEDDEEGEGEGEEEDEEMMGHIHPASKSMDDVQYEDYYDYGEDYKSADDSIDASLLSSSV